MGFLIHQLFTHYLRIHQVTLRRKMATFNLIPNPLTLGLHFESSILPSLRQHFQNSSIKGCNFHFTQGVWCKVKSLCLVVHYKSHPKKNATIHSSVVDDLLLQQSPRWTTGNYPRLTNCLNTSETLS